MVYEITPGRQGAETMGTRTIGVVTVARSDYGVYLPLLRRIQADPDLHLHLYVSGMHLSPEFGLTVREIEKDGFKVAERIEMLVSSDTPEGIAKSMGLGTIGFAQALNRLQPDILLLLGDRFEMHSAAVAALPFNISIAHIGGGDRTEGAIDDALRHSITKMSHLHFAVTQDHARRLAQMGEEKWRISVTGAPSLDTFHQVSPQSAEEFEAQFGFGVEPAPLLITFHPVTREYEHTSKHIRNLLDAVERAEMPLVFTYPNADTAGRQIIQAINAFVSSHSQSWVVANLGTRGYISLLHYASAMVGNSSSGIIEAPSFELPVVNVGTRQQGRLQARNVINVGYSSEEIHRGIVQATSEEFKANLSGLSNPYGDGHSAERIVGVLRAVDIGSKLLSKSFSDYAIPWGSEGEGEGDRDCRGWGTGT